MNFDNSFVLLSNLQHHCHDQLSKLVSLRHSLMNKVSQECDLVCEAVVIIGRMTRGAVNVDVSDKHPARYRPWIFPCTNRENLISFIKYLPESGASFPGQHASLPHFLLHQHVCLLLLAITTITESRRSRLSLSHRSLIPTFI